MVNGFGKSSPNDRTIQISELSEFTEKYGEVDDNCEEWEIFRGVVKTERLWTWMFSTFGVLEDEVEHSCAPEATLNQT